MKTSVPALLSPTSVQPSLVVDVLWTGDAEKPLVRRRNLPTPPFVMAIENAWRLVSERHQRIDLFIYAGGKKPSVGCHGFIGPDGQVVNVRFRSGDVQLLDDNADEMYAELANHLGRGDQIVRLKDRAEALRSKNFPRRIFGKKWILTTGDESNSTRLAELLETHS